MNIKNINSNLAQVDINAVLLEHDYCTDTRYADNNTRATNFKYVDTWCNRLVQVPTGSDWKKIIDRDLAMHKVKYPFLPEQQIRGKVYKKLGIPSVMGELLRRAAAIYEGTIPEGLLKGRKRSRMKMESSAKVTKLENFSELSNLDKQRIADFGNVIKLYSGVKRSDNNPNVKRNEALPENTSTIISENVSPATPDFELRNPRPVSGMTKPEENHVPSGNTDGSLSNYSKNRNTDVNGNSILKKVADSRMNVLPQKRKRDQELNWRYVMTPTTFQLNKKSGSMSRTLENFRNTHSDREKSSIPQAFDPLGTSIATELSTSLSQRTDPLDKENRDRPYSQQSSSLDLRIRDSKRFINFKRYYIEKQCSDIDSFNTNLSFLPNFNFKLTKAESLNNKHREDAENDKRSSRVYSNKENLPKKPIFRVTNSQSCKAAKSQQFERYYATDGLKSDNIDGTMACEIHQLSLSDFNGWNGIMSSANPPKKRKIECSLDKITSSPNCTLFKISDCVSIPSSPESAIVIPQIAEISKNNANGSPMTISTCGTTHSNVELLSNRCSEFDRNLTPDSYVEPLSCVEPLSLKSEGSLQDLLNVSKHVAHSKIQTILQFLDIDLEIV